MKPRLRKATGFCGLLAVIAGALLLHCVHPSPPQAALRLCDLYQPAKIEGAVAPVAQPPRTEVRFDRIAKPGETGGWEALHGVAGLTVEGGRLAGRSTDEFPILHYERTSGLEDTDLVSSIEIRVRASAGANLALDFDGAEKVDPGEVLDGARSFPAAFTTPLVAGPELRTYTLKTPLSAPLSRFRQIFVRPTDVAGATFEIESLRLVLRREYLASVASGVSWQGLGEIYKETLVSRAPEKIHMPVTLPPRPWLDLALGTVEDAPVTFRLLVSRPGKTDETLIERTVTRSQRWENAPADLGRFAGEAVDLVLQVAAERSGALGFWGSPVVRSLGAEPARTADAGPAAPHGVILIWADTLRRDHLGVYGYGRSTTPNLERLAREGVLFRDCVGQASWTKVATPSLLSSLYPTTHGVKDFLDRLPNSATTLAEVYRQAGYATLSFSSILFTGKLTNLHRGFEEVHEDGSLPDRNSSKTAREYVDRLLPWLEAHREAPFFVFLHVADPHDPYKPYPPYDSLWASPARTAEHEKQNKAVRKFINDPLMKAFGMPTREELTRAGIDAAAYEAVDEDWYDGSIRAMDAEIGRLVERLRSLGLDRKTVVAFTSDHGEEFLDHGRTFHGQSVYGEMNNMSLILWGQDSLPRGMEVGATVQTVDIMPTLLDLSGLPLPPQVQGHSLLPLFSGGESSAAASGDGREWKFPAISEKAVTANNGAPPPRQTESLAIISGGWKLIRNSQRDAGKAEFELYDHLRDPLDQHDLAGARPADVAQLVRQLTAWKAAAEHARLKPDSTSDVSKEELERLRALGYLQ